MSLQVVPMDIVQANEIAIGETLRSAEIARTQVLEGYQQQAETMRALFQKMQQTIEQQAAENGALKVSLVAAETKNREAETVHKHEVEALKKLVDEAAHQDRLHKEETEALKKQMQHVGSVAKSIEIKCQGICKQANLDNSDMMAMWQFVRYFGFKPLLDPTMNAQLKSRIPDTRPMLSQLFQTIATQANSIASEAKTLENIQVKK